MGRRSTDPERQDDQYERKQQQYWKQLHQELDRYKSELGATNSELAQHLGISRQPVVSFMQDPSVGLPIRRSNLERLWDLLSDPEQMKYKSLSSAARAARQELRQQGADALLSAAGFLPNTIEKPLAIHPTRSEEIRRIVSRLSTVPVSDFNFIRLIDAIETLIATNVPSDNFQKFDLSSPSQRAETWLEQWMNDRHLTQFNDPHSIDKFKNAVTQLSVLGQYELGNAELFELYMSILENERAVTPVNELLQLRVNQCQFKTLTFSLQEAAPAPIQAEIYRASLDAERQLRSALQPRPCQDSPYLEDAVRERVLEASVICSFRKTRAEVRWRYSSSGTHYENMLSAIGYGMGYEARLDILELSLRSLGRKSYSLVKASMALQDVDHHATYRGTWVDRSAITSLIQSAAIAARQWLAEQFVDPDGYQEYYEMCRFVAAIDERLVQARKTLNSYRLHLTELTGSASISDFLEREVIDPIDRWRAEKLAHNSVLNACYGERLEEKYCIAKLWCAHSALLEGRMAIADKELTEVATHLKTLSGRYLKVEVLYQIETTLQKYFLGDRALLSDKAAGCAQLEHLITLLSQSVEAGIHRGRFDEDIYMIASEVFGRMGRMQFCLSPRQDVDGLELSVQNSLKAAYCSAKIGCSYRTGHWLTNASRACCRLGQGERAREFANLARDIIERSLEPTYSFDYRQAILAAFYLARAERRLLLDRDRAAALEDLLRALKGGIYTGFVRLIADCLYNIYRAAKDWDNSRLKPSFQAAFPSSEGLQDWQLKEDRQGWRDNRIAVEVIHFYNQLDLDADWSLVADQFKQQAQQIWRQLANPKDANPTVLHPFEEAMETEQFLCKMERG